MNEADGNRPQAPETDLGSKPARGPGGWLCPYCQTPMPLTWRRYFAEPGLEHTCPSCGRVSRLSAGTSPVLWLARACGVLVGAVLLAAIGSLFGMGGCLAGLVAGGLGAGFAVDGYLDAHYRRLVPLAASQSDGPGTPSGRCP